MFLCALCRLPAGGDRLCRACVAVLPRNEPSCPGCARPLPGASSTPCGRCQKRPPAYARAIAPYRYAFPMDRAVQNLKFGRQLVYAPAFAALLAPVVRAEMPDRDGLVPVPLHRWRRWRRGFNQAAEIGRHLAGLTGLPVADVARRTRATRSQTGLRAPARRANVAGAFEVRTLGHCRHPLVLDDVITTGATADQLARALIAAGASDVFVLAVARSG